MSPRKLICIAVLAAASSAMGAPSAIKVGDSWTFETRNGYRPYADSDAAYRVDVTAVSNDGIETRVTGLTDGTVSTERFTRGWDPTSAEWLSKHVSWSAMDYPNVPDRLLPGIRWEDEALSNRLPAKRPMMQPYKFTPPYPELPDSLEAGVTWRGTVVSQNSATGRHMKMEVSGKVVGSERIHVPAGDFDTIKVVRETYLDDENETHGQTHVVDTEWFAPALGRSIKYDTRSDYNEKADMVVGSRLIPGEWTVYQLTAYKTN